MKMLDYQNSAVANMVKMHPELRFASKAIEKKSIFGDKSPTMIAAGLGNKLGKKGPSIMNHSVQKSGAMRAMKFMFGRMGG